MANSIPDVLEFAWNSGRMNPKAKKTTVAAKKGMDDLKLPMTNDAGIKLFTMKMPTNPPAPVVAVTQPPVVPLVGSSGGWKWPWLMGLGAVVLAVIVWLVARKTR